MYSAVSYHGKKHEEHKQTSNKFLLEREEQLLVTFTFHHFGDDQNQLIPSLRLTTGCWCKNILLAFHFGFLFSFLLPKKRGGVVAKM